MRLSEARASGRLDAAFDGTIDRLATELDLARSASRGLRGEPRQQLIDRLAAIDVELLRGARAALDEKSRAELTSAAEDELAGFRARMRPEAFTHACDGAFDRLLRERAGLPVVAFQP